MDEEEKNDEDVEVVEVVEVVEDKEGKKTTRKFIKKLQTTTGGFWGDFKKFISKGNVVQLAVAFIMGAAFTAIVNSLVGDIFMPFFSLIFGKTDISSLQWVISDDLIIYYGRFILAVLNFLLISLVLFLIIKIFANAEKGIKKLKKNQAPPPEPEPVIVPPTKTEELLTDIKELLEKNNKK